MREHPTLFSSAMVQAILAGRKTQTRRVVNEFKDMDTHHAKSAIYPARADGWIWWYPDCPGLDEFCKRQYEHGVMCRYGKPGDRLWVRESWRAPVSLDPSSATQIAEKARAANYPEPWCPIEYADGQRRNWDDGAWGHEAGRLRSGRFMPRWASRIMLEITAVRVERLQSITQDDAKAEGVEIDPCDHARRSCEDVGCRGPYVAPFSELWDRINAERGYGWDVNPFVWVVEFRRCA